MHKILPVIFVALIIFIAIFSPFLKIKKVVFKDENNCLASQSEDKNLNLFGKNILTLNSDVLAKNIKEKYSCTDQAKIKKNYPSTITIEITTKKPVAIIEGTEFSIREDGFVSDQQNTKDLPKIFLPETIKAQAGSKITDPIVTFTLKITSELQKSDFTPTSIRILNPPDIAIYDSKGTIVLFTQEKTAEIQVDSLQSVFAKAKIDPTKIAKIDLRFEKPVITTKQ